MLMLIAVIVVITEVMLMMMSRLNVHLVAHSHDDVGWLKTVDQYYQVPLLKHQNDQNIFMKITIYYLPSICHKYKS